MIKYEHDVKDNEIITTATFYVCTKSNWPITETVDLQNRIKKEHIKRIRYELYGETIRDLEKAIMNIIEVTGFRSHELQVILNKLRRG